MTLETDGRTFDVAQSGPDFLILTEPASFPAGAGFFSISVDGEVSTSPTNVQELVNSRRVLSADVETAPA